MLVNPVVTDRERRVKPPVNRSCDPLLSDEPTVELVSRARAGDRQAVEALLQRCLPPLKRWAHGKLPPAARDSLDTGDLVQEAALRALKRLDVFEPRHVGAMQAYLRQSVINRVRDEVRRVRRRPAVEELQTDHHPADSTSPFEAALRAQSYERYHQALEALQPRDRKLVVARVEAQWSYVEITNRFGLPTVDAARVAVGRALKRLAKEMKAKESKD
jgi:RNA polymerase sigma-70 factor, ECF subfamily